MTCACGCGQPVSSPPRGGLIWYRDFKPAWYASNECMAREEAAVLGHPKEERER